MITTRCRQDYRGGGGYAVAVGYPNPAASPFAPLGAGLEAEDFTDDADEAAGRYRRWLWRQVKRGRESAAYRELARLAGRARRGDLVLLYPAEPLAECALVLKSCLEWMARGEREAWSEWARAHISRGALVLDVETTGVEGDDEVVEVAVADAATGGLLIDTLVRPTRPVGAGAAAVNGITDGALALAPRWPEVSGRLREALEGRTVLAYNASFDSRLLAQTCRAHGEPPLPVAEWGCIMRAYRGFAAHGRYPSLARASAELGVPAPGAHRAAADALTAFGVLGRMAEGGAPAGRAAGSPRPEGGRQEYAAPGESPSAGRAAGAPGA